MSKEQDQQNSSDKMVYEKPKLVRHDELQKTINPYGPRPSNDEDKNQK